MVSDLVVVVSTLFVAFGVAGVYMGWKRRGVHALMAEVERTAIRHVDSPGTVEVEGTAVAADGTTRTPTTGRDAVAAAWRVEEWDERGDTSTWREVARGIEVVPFVVEDETGAIDVDGASKRDTAGKWTQTTGVSASDGVRIDDVLLEFESFPVECELDPDEDPPDGVRRLHDDHGLYEDTGSVTNVADVGTEHGTRRYAEQAIEPGDDVYVLGRVEGRDDPDRQRLHPDTARIRAPDDGLFVVSDQDEASLEDEFAASYRALLYGGVASIVGGLALVAVSFV